VLKIDLTGPVNHGSAPGIRSALFWARNHDVTAVSALELELGAFGHIGDVRFSHSCSLRWSLLGAYDPLTCILEELKVIKSNIHDTLPGIAATLGGCATRALDDDVAVLH